MRCERCQNEVPDNATHCSFCGANLRPNAGPSSGYINPQYPEGNYQQPSNYQPGNYQQPSGGYPQQPGGYPQQPSGYPQQPGGYQQPSGGYQQQPMYQQPGPGYPGVNVTVVNNAMQQNTTPLVVEIILSIFGIYGVGWLMSGETTIGVVLLICSVFVYWPIVALSVIFTLGLGVFCVGPLAIAAIVVNAILLNNRLKQKAAQVSMMGAPMSPMGPQY